MRTLLVNGSPHTIQGVHVSILNAFEKGLTKGGSETTRIDIYNQKIQPCKGCFTCWTKTPGECIQKDDMESLLPLVAQSDILALVTPVYVDGMTGPLKTFLDRVIPLIKGRVEIRDDHMRHIVRDTTKISKMVLLSASGFSELDNFDPLVSHVKAITRNLGCDYAGEILLPSGWVLRRKSEDMDNVSTMIERAGLDLINVGKIPGCISSDIHAIVSRSEVVDIMNRYYGKYE
jgi:multimeric flavodoxin WrbA